MSLEEKLDTLIELAKASLQMQPQKKTCNYTIAEWAKIWLDTYKKSTIRESTYIKYEGINRNYIIKYFGSVRLNELDPIQAQQIFVSIPYPRERQSILAQMKQMYDKAVQLNIIDYNPLLSIELPKHKKKAGNALTRAEENEFIKECSKSVYCDFFMVCLKAGLRRGEALALTPADIDFDKKRISVSKSYNNKKIHFPKTDAGLRIVPLFDDLLAYITKYKDAPKNKRIFPYDETTVHEGFTRVCNRCLFETDRHFTIHSLRHTFITRCAEKRIDLKTVAKWVGHSDINMTMQIYTHVNNDFEQEEIENYNRRNLSTE
ncbi:MAG: site-specific integrase [Firmicutes bacterium]|nr:site-specific integrase [Bacillota bacterium]MCM1393908.1 site-specific integrase [[Eubacterium] siraeum]